MLMSHGSGSIPSRRIGFTLNGTCQCEGPAKFIMSLIRRVIQRFQGLRLVLYRLGLRADKLKFVVGPTFVTLHCMAASTIAPRSIYRSDVRRPTSDVHPYSTPLLWTSAGALKSMFWHLSTCLSSDDSMLCFNHHVPVDKRVL